MRVCFYPLFFAVCVHGVVFPSTFVVNSNGDTNTLGTFRYALNHAVSGDSIEFQPGIGPIVLTSNLPVITQNNLGISASETQVINGGGSYRVFAIGNDAASPTVSFSNISVINGLAQGGLGGYTYYGGGGGGGLGAGGGFFVKGSVTLDSISISNCQAIGGAGGDSGDVSSTQNSGAGGGGASLCGAAVNGGNAFPISQGGAGGGDGGGSGATMYNQSGGNATEIGGGGGGAAPGDTNPGSVGGNGGVGLYGGGGGGAGSGATQLYAGGNGGAAGFGAGGGGAGKGGVSPLPLGGSGGILGGDGGSTDTSTSPYFVGAGGGGGAGVGGAIFVYEGSSLTVAGSSSINDGTVTGGNGGNTPSVSQKGSPGTGFANGIFLDQGATLILDGTFNADFTIDSYPSRPDGGVTLLGGAVTLSSINTYAGGTVVTGGSRLSVNGQILGGITVYSGGTLGGTGTIYGGGTILGTLSPGNSIGTLTFDTAGGNLTLESSSITDIEIDPTDASKIVITGGGHVALGGTVHVIQDAGSYPSEGQYTILEGAYTGTFNPTVTGGTMPFRLAYMTDLIYLLFGAAPSQIPTNSLSGNALAIANSLNQNGSPSTISFFTDLSGNSLQNALSSVSPARNAFGTYITAQTAFSISNLVSTHLDGLRLSFQEASSNSFLSALTADRSDRMAMPVKNKRSGNKLSAWVSGFGEFAHEEASLQNPSFHFISEAVLTGVDYQGDNRTVVGGSLGYAHTHYQEDNHVGHGDINYYITSFYGNGFLGDFYLSPAIWGIFNQIDNTRKISFPGFSKKTHADIFAWQCIPHLEVGYDVQFSWGDLIPFTSADWAISWQRGYREEGASPFNAKQKAHSSSMVRSETGFKFCEKWGCSWGAFFLKEKVSYVFEKPFGTGTVNTAFVGTPGAFTVSAVNQNLNLGAVGLNALFSIGKEKPLIVDVGYEGEFGSRYWSSELMLTISKSF